MDYIFLVPIVFIIFGLVLIFVTKKLGVTNSKIKFYSDYLYLPDGIRIFYKNILSIKLKSIYISMRGWEPRILVMYKTRSQKKVFVIKPQFFPRPSYIGELFEKNYETDKFLQKLRRYMPDKIDDFMNSFLNNEEIKFEDLEQMDKMIGVEMIKPRGRFRIRE